MWGLTNQGAHDLARELGAALTQSQLQSDQLSSAHSWPCGPGRGMRYGPVALRAWVPEHTLASACLLSFCLAPAAPAREQCSLSSHPSSLSSSKVTSPEALPFYPSPFQPFPQFIIYTHTHICLLCLFIICLSPQTAIPTRRGPWNPKHPAQGLAHDKPVIILC